MNSSTMHHDQQPVFLNNSPAIICEQILCLVKKLGLEFQCSGNPVWFQLKLEEALRK